MKQMMSRIGIALAALIVLSTLSFAQAPKPAKEPATKKESTASSAKHELVDLNSNQGTIGSAARNRRCLC